MEPPEPIGPDHSSGSPSLNGYLYQLDVSIWAALDLMVAKKLAHSVVLEPASEEDLEAELTDDEVGPVETGATLGKYRLVLQAKLRDTGPWSLEALRALLQHGKRRASAAARLKDPAVRYLLVTSADLVGTARDLRVTSFGAWPREALPSSVAKLLPADAAGRFAVLSAEDAWKIDRRLRELLQDAFKVPHTHLDACREALRADALVRMRGPVPGVWQRDEIEATIKTHLGFVASSAEVDGFVAPTNWSAFQRALHDRNAVIITGPSGTGKTMAAEKLWDEARGKVPGIARVDAHEPQDVRATPHTGPVVFMIEDPWGRYRFEPKSEPWNDELPKFLTAARPDRLFIVTSRSDVLQESRSRDIPKKWFVQLESEHYGQPERIRLFENRVPGLPRHLQLLATTARSLVLDRLDSPSEIQSFFSSFGDDRQPDEKDRAFVERCITAAHRDSIEKTIAQRIASRSAWSWAAIVWGLLKARPQLSRSILPEVQSGLADHGPEFEDGLEPLINSLVAARDLRQIETALTYRHPRVEAGLETAMVEKPNMSARALATLTTVLIALDMGDDDWGRESAALLVQAARRLDSIKLKLTPAVQAGLDAWVSKRLGDTGPEFRKDLQLAADVGSAECLPAQLAQWLVHHGSVRMFAFPHWEPPARSDAWYDAVRTHPLTAKICDAFVRRVLPYESGGYPDDFWTKLDRLAPGLSGAFVDAAITIIGHGYNPNDDAIANGALVDLDGFAPVVTAAIDELQALRAKGDDGTWLAIRNGEYSEDYAQHLAESTNEDGYTAGEFLGAYVRELRRTRGWEAVRDHPHVAEFVWYWLDQVKSSEAPVSDPEIDALAKLAFDTRHEDALWTLGLARWTYMLREPLIRRLVAGTEDRQLRIGALTCLAVKIPACAAQVVAALAATNDVRRLLELALDAAAARGDDDWRSAVDETLAAILAALPEPVRLVARAMADNATALPEPHDRAVALLRTLDAGPNPILRLFQARLLAPFADVGPHIDQVLAQTDDIDVATVAIELAASLDMWPRVSAALTNRFADVRMQALEALAARFSGPLSPELLALASDPGNRVRRKLLALLKARRHVEHLEALTVLATDQWSPESTYYGEEASYPIANDAIILLGEPPELPDACLDRLFAVASETESGEIRDGMLRSIAQNGSDLARTRIADLALATGTPKLHAAASRAMFSAVEKVAPADAQRIDANQLKRRWAAIAVPLAFVIGWRSPKDHTMAIATALAADANRKVLLVPLWLAAAERDPALGQEMGRLLPTGRAEVILSAAKDGPKLARTAFDDLGDVRTVTQVVRYLDTLFEARS